MVHSDVNCGYGLLSIFIFPLKSFSAVQTSVSFLSFCYTCLVIICTIASSTSYCGISTLKGIDIDYLEGFFTFLAAIPLRFIFTFSDTAFSAFYICAGRTFHLFSLNKRNSVLSVVIRF